jgi:hypothetical protein
LKIETYHSTLNDKKFGLDKFNLKSFINKDKLNEIKITSYKEEDNYNKCNLQ